MRTKGYGGGHRFYGGPGGGRVGVDRQGRVVPIHEHRRDPFVHREKHRHGEKDGWVWKGGNAPGIRVVSENPSGYRTKGFAKPSRRAQLKRGYGRAREEVGYIRRGLDMVLGDGKKVGPKRRRGGHRRQPGRRLSGRRSYSRRRNGNVW